MTKDPAGVRVISPIDDTPAARAGVRAGDIITKIDGESVADVTLNDAVKRMRGEPDTKIELTVARKGEMKPLTFHLTRAIIKTQSVKMQKLDGGFGYIRISQFQERTTEDLAKYLNELAEAKSLKGLVLDLRNDPGGLLQAAIGVSAAFLPANTDVVSTKGRAPQSDYVFKAIESDYRSGNAVRALADLTPLAKTVPIVVLINSSSASASEIVAGALQDHKRAVIMGDRSFGKGSVQTILPMTFGDKTVGVKLTTARYYTPSGRSIQPRASFPTCSWTTPPSATIPPSRSANPIFRTTSSTKTRAKRKRRRSSMNSPTVTKTWSTCPTTRTSSGTKRTGSCSRPCVSSRAKRSRFRSTAASPERKWPL